MSKMCLQICAPMAEGNMGSWLAVTPHPNHNPASTLNTEGFVTLQIKTR